MGDAEISLILAANDDSESFPGQRQAISPAQHVLGDPAWARRLTEVKLKAMDSPATYELLKTNTRPSLEQEHGLSIEDSVLAEVLRRTDKLNTTYPAKATKFLDGVCSFVKLNDRKVVTIKDVEEYVELNP